MLLKFVFEMCKCKSLFYLSKHLTAIYLYSKKFVLFLLSFRKCNPTISELVALVVWMFEGHSKGHFIVTKVTWQEILVTTIGF